MEWGGALAPGTCRIRRYRAPPGVCGHDIALGLSSRARLRAPPSRKGRQSRARRTPVWHARPRTVVTGYELVRVIHACNACATRTRCGGGHAHAGPPRTWWQVWAVHPVCSTLSTAGGARPTLVQDSIAVWAPHPHVTIASLTRWRLHELSVCRLHRFSRCGQPEPKQGAYVPRWESICMAALTSAVGDFSG